MSDDRQEPSAGESPGDKTRPIPPPAGEPPAPQAADRTAPLDRTTPAEQTGPAAPWSGRAEVPPPRTAGYPDQGPGEWYGEEQGDTRWWMPIAVGSVALLLLAVLGVGLWLIVDAENEPGPGESPLPSPTSAPATTSAPTSPATTAASATPPTTPPATTIPAQVPMPPLVGLPRSAAEGLLERLGLGYRSELRRSDRPAGTVIETDPRAGEAVPAGSDVTLVVSDGGAETSAPPTPTPTVSATG